MAFWNPPENRPISKLVSIVNRNGWNEFIERLRKNPDVTAMRDEGASIAATAVNDPKTLDGVLQELPRRTYGPGWASILTR